MIVLWVCFLYSMDMDQEKRGKVVFMCSEGLYAIKTYMESVAKWQGKLFMVFTEFVIILMRFLLSQRQKQKRSSLLFLSKKN